MLDKSKSKSTLIAVQEGKFNFKPFGVRFNSICNWVLKKSKF